MAPLTSQNNNDQLHQGPLMGFIWGPAHTNNNSDNSAPRLEQIKLNNSNDGEREGEGEGEEEEEEAQARVTPTSKKRRSRGKKNGEHEMHIWTERERRKKMRNMFASLHALLPNLPSKADKSSIVDEAVSYIKTLEQNIEKLEKQKQERLQTVSSNFGCESSVGKSYGYSRESAMEIGGCSNAFSKAVAFQTWSSPNVVLNICGDEAQFCIFSTKKPGLLTTIAFVMEKHKIEVISANVVCNANGNAYMILAHAKGALLQLTDANSVEETYRQAAAELMMWIN